MTGWLEVLQDNWKIDQRISPNVPAKFRSHVLQSYNVTGIFVLIGLSLRNRGRLDFLLAPWQLFPNSAGSITLPAPFEPLEKIKRQPKRPEEHQQMIYPLRQRQLLRVGAGTHQCGLGSTVNENWSSHCRQSACSEYPATFSRSPNINRSGPPGSRLPVAPGPNCNLSKIWFSHQTRVKSRLDPLH